MKITLLILISERITDTHTQNLTNSINVVVIINVVTMTTLIKMLEEKEGEKILLLPKDKQLCRHFGDKRN
jgi:hypothetical protein